MNTTFRNATLTAAVAATLALAACDRRNDSQTAGQTVDRTVASAGKAGEQVKQSATEATDNITAGAKDMAVTTKINAALAADAELSAIRIDVDTKDGKVVLTGTAPDAASRERATKMASAMDGVTAVDNRLTVK